MMIQQAKSHQSVSPRISTPNEPDELNQAHRALIQKEARDIDRDFQQIRDGLVEVDTALERVSAETGPTTEELNKIKNWKRKRGAKGGIRGKTVAAAASGVGLIGGTVGGKITLGVMAKALGVTATKALGATAAKALGVATIAAAGPIVGGVALGIAGAVVGWKLVRGNEAQVDRIREKLDDKEQGLTKVEEELGGLEQRAQSTIVKAQANQEARGEALELWQEQIAESEGQLIKKTSELVKERAQTLYDAENQRLQQREANLEQRRGRLDTEEARVDQLYAKFHLGEQPSVEPTQSATASLKWHFAHA
jgi:hypothetical protein